MLTKIITLPHGDEPLLERVEKIIRVEYPAEKWVIKSCRKVAKPHLPSKGEPCWVTLWPVEE